MENLAQILIATYFIIVIYGVFKGAGENREIVVFDDYNDLGLTFLVPASFVLINFIGLYIGLDPVIGIAIGSIVVIILLSKLIKQTSENNNRELKKTILALLTKIPLAVIWVLNLIQVLNPSGNTGAQRRQNRGKSMVILAILTPIIGLLVVNKSGSYFNPKSWLAGRRVGSIRTHM